jgi:hypothetical protein
MSPTPPLAVDTIPPFRDNGSTTPIPPEGPDATVARGLLRCRTTTRPGPTMVARNGALQEVARTIAAAQGKGLSPDDIVLRAGLPSPDVEVVLSFLLFISAAVRDETDLYRANCPCVEGEALSRFQTLQDLDDTEDTEFGAVAAGLPAASRVTK